MSSTSFHSTATMRNWKKKTNATSGIDERDWSRSLFARFAVETVHNCDCCSEVWSEFHRCISEWFVQWDIPVFLISRTPQRMDSRNGLPVPIYPSRCTSPRSSEFWVANLDVLDLVGNDRKFHQNSFWCISSARYGLWSAVSVPQFCRAEYRGVAPSWWRSAELREHPVAND